MTEVREEWIQRADGSWVYTKTHQTKLTDFFLPANQSTLIDFGFGGDGNES